MSNISIPYNLAQLVSLGIMIKHNVHTQCLQPHYFSSRTKSIFLQSHKFSRAEFGHSHNHVHRRRGGLIKESSKNHLIFKIINSVAFWGTDDHIQNNQFCRILGAR